MRPDPDARQFEQTLGEGVRSSGVAEYRAAYQQNIEPHT
jgi:hypothetical protein